MLQSRRRRRPPLPFGFVQAQSVNSRPRPPPRRRRRRLFFENMGTILNQPPIYIEYSSNHPMNQTNPINQKQQQQQQSLRRRKRRRKRAGAEEQDLRTLLLEDDDKEEDQQGQEPLKEEEQEEPTTVGFAPIRIHFITQLLDLKRGQSIEFDAYLDNIINVYLPQAAQHWSQHLHVASVPDDAVIPVAPDVCSGIFGIPLLVPNGGIANADLVIVVTAQDALYDSHHGSSSGNDGGGDDNNNDDKDNDNVTNSTMMMTPVCDGGALALASACALDQFDRPVIGFMNWCYRPPYDHVDYDDDNNNNNNTLPPGVFTSLATALQTAFLPPLNISVHEVTADYPGVALHEIGHVLGFASWLYKYFRFPDGTPRTPRPFDTPEQEQQQQQPMTCVNGETEWIVRPSNETTLTEVIDPQDGSRTFYLSTPRILRVVRNQFNCPTAIGAELANDGEGAGCVGSHWAERYFLGEVMSPALSSASENVLSPLTLALMEDTGWYRVDYRFVKTPVFGLDAGCDFVNEPCIQNDRVPDWGQGLFCDAPIRFADTTIATTIADPATSATSTTATASTTTISTTDCSSRTNTALLAPESYQALGCDVSHRHWTLCDLWYMPTIPAGVEVPNDAIRYFSDPNLVSLYQLTESCPLPLRPLGVDCMTEPGTEGTPIPYEPYYIGEAFGSNSRCIEASSSLSLTSSGADVLQDKDTKRLIRPACLPIRCDAKLRKLVLEVAGIDHVCDYDGQILSSRHDKDNTTTQWTCPKLVTVCPDLASCPGLCSGRGTCVFGSSSSSSSSGGGTAAGGGGGNETTMQQQGQAPYCLCDEGEPNNEGCYPLFDDLLSTSNSPATATDSTAKSSTTTTSSDGPPQPPTLEDPWTENNNGRGHRHDHDHHVEDTVSWAGRSISMTRLVFLVAGWVTTTVLLSWL